MRSVGQPDTQLDIQIRLIVLLCLIQILLAKELSIQDGNQNNSLHQSTTPEVKTNNLADLDDKETVFDIPPTHYKDIFQDDVKEKDTPVPQTFREDKPIKSEHLSAEKPLLRNRGLHRKSRDLTGHDHKKSGTNGDIGRREAPKLSITTEDPMVGHNDTLSENVTTSGNGQGLNRTQVAGREKRSENCPASPDGELESCIPCQDEFFATSLTYEHTDEHGNTCTCELCLAPQYMKGSCVCPTTSGVGEVLCLFPVEGISYMPFPNKCTKPFQCTNECPGNLVKIKGCETDKNSVCGCDEENGYYQTGDTTCSEIPSCPNGYELKLDLHPGDRYTSYSCCSDDNKCIKASDYIAPTTEKPSAEPVNGQPDSTQAPTTSRGVNHGTSSSSEKGQQHHTSTEVQDLTRLPTPKPVPEINESADDTILDSNSQIALLVVVGVLATLLVVVIVAVVVGLCFVFGRKTADTRAIATAREIRYHRGANNEDGYVHIAMA